MSTLLLLDVGPIEMLVLAIAAIMLFGGDLPDLARRAGQFVGRLRSAAGDITREIDVPPDLHRLPEPDDALHRPPPPVPPTPQSKPPEQPPPPPT